MHKLAIVIPYYKSDYFEECIESLAYQTNKDFTLYIGDDASPDAPNEILQKYQDKINIVYSRFESNLGGTFLTKQWDRCIGLSKNEQWIMLLGDDDKLSYNAVEEFYNAIEEIDSKNINVVRNNVIEIDANNNTLREFFFPKLEKSTDSYIKKIIENYHVSLPEYIFKKEVYQKYGFKHFPFAYGSDNLAWIEYSENNDIYTLSSYIYVRNSDKSISGGGKNIREKVYAMYLTKKYILIHYSNLFSKQNRLILAKKAHKELVFSKKRAYKERSLFALLTAKLYFLK